MDPIQITAGEYTALAYQAADGTWHTMLDLPRGPVLVTGKDQADLVAQAQKAIDEDLQPANRHDGKILVFVTLLLAIAFTCMPPW